MSQPIKVPKEVMELAYETAACEELASACSLLRGLFYKHKAIKLKALIWRTMHKVFPQTSSGDWSINVLTGMATETLTALPAVKKPRKPRAAKPAAADPANSLGE